MLWGAWRLQQDALCPSVTLLSCAAADSEEVRAALRDERLQELVQQIDSAHSRPKVCTG